MSAESIDVEHPNAGTRDDGSTTRVSFSVATRAAFCDRVVDRLRRELPADLRTFHAKPGFQLLKISFANERVHYEVGIDVERARIEIALHFEDGPLSTAAYLALIDRSLVEIKHDLGWSIELERWTASWGRLYEHRPVTKLDRAAADEAAERLAALVTVLQPIIESAHVPPERSAQPASQQRSRWKRASR